MEVGTGGGGCHSSTRDRKQIKEGSASLKLAGLKYLVILNEKEQGNQKPAALIEPGQLWPSELTAF